jgi:hypothetical protein
MRLGSAIDIAEVVSCCFPRPDPGTQLSVFGLVAIYGFAEDKRWAKWAGAIGLAGVVLSTIRCVRRRLEADAPTRAEGTRSIAPSSSEPIQVEAESAN